MARIYEQQGEMKLAAQHYAQLSPEDITEDDMDMLFEAQFRLARLKYLIDGDENGEGHEVFEELRAANPDQAITLFIEEARLLMDLGREADTVELLGQALEVYPDNESLLYSRSLAYERNGQPIQAQDDLRSILANDENNSTALNALGYMLTNNNGDLQEAYDLIDRALELSPEDPAIIDSMGWVLFSMGRYEEALEYLERANDALLDEEVISHLAETLHVLGRTDEAREVLAQGLEDLPDSDMIPETRARLGLDD
jgi:tetratricopeptide (TPR) repeat protein